MPYNNYGFSQHAYIKINDQLKHKFREYCSYSKLADAYEMTNPDNTSLFVEFPDGEIDEISFPLIEEA